MVSIAVVGTHFGRDFVPIYASHPDVSRVGICDTDAARLARVGDELGIDDRFATLDDLIDSGRYDGVHLTTPVRLHADQVVTTLHAGLHTACAVPMATSLADVDRIIAAQRASGRNYMMMETSVYSREFRYVKQLHDAGRLGDLTFLRGVHIQDLDGYPPYWMGYPPMTYSTHALSPLLALSGARVTDVHCLGSGQLQERYRGGWGDSFPVETALFRLDRGKLAAEVTLSFFQTARQYQEGFSVYGDRLGVEWPALEGGPMLIHEPVDMPPGHRGRGSRVTEVDPPDVTESLPAAIAAYAGETTFQPPGGRPPVRFGAGHGGSHPHLAHEFIRSIVAVRPPAVDAATAATWTAPGICGHLSALRGGERVAVPHY